MKLRSWLVAGAALLVAWTLAAPAARADKLELKDGRQIEGIIIKVENGQVTVSIGQEQRQFSILDVTSMNFDTPHVAPGAAPQPAEHFAAGSEAQDVARHIQSVDQAARELRQALDQMTKQWGGRKTIAPNEVAAWDASKDQFSRTLSRYQEVLGDLYEHVVGRVDQYDRLAKEAAGVRVGVQGALNVGSSLISKEQQEPPLKKFVPNPWYDNIFYKGYSLGYTEGYYGARPREFVAPQ